MILQLINPTLEVEGLSRAREALQAHTNAHTGVKTSGVTVLAPLPAEMFESGPISVETLFEYCLVAGIVPLALYRKEGTFENSKPYLCILPQSVEVFNTDTIIVLARKPNPKLKIKEESFEE